MYTIHKITSGKIILPVTNKEQLFLQGKIKNPFILCNFVTVYYYKSENSTSSNRRKSTGSPLLSGLVINLLLMPSLFQTKLLACLVIVMIMREPLVEFCSYNDLNTMGKWPLLEKALELIMFHIFSFTFHIFILHSGVAAVWWFLKTRDRQSVWVQAL